LPDYLQVLIPNASNIPRLWSKIHSFFTSIHARRSLDLDSLAQDILIEAWQNGTPVTSQFIRHRFINLYHSGGSYSAALERSVTREAPENRLEASDETKDKLNRIILLASLSSIEMQIVIMIFTMDMTHEEVQIKMFWSESRFRQVISSTMGKLKTAGRLIEAEDSLKTLKTKGKV
jgi:predicted enzyme involved in methoxymalonyl-ACP biosynthesis